ncbi:MAG: hypothetical protein U5N53_28460 [Mycobacterium sp.]|nr:hypothetical protein [Mycobacterium sp.]
MSDIGKLFGDTLIANDGALPHPSGDPVRLAQFSTGNLPPGLREQVTEEHQKTLMAIGEALAFVLETNGIATTSAARLDELLTKEKAFDGVRPPMASMYCADCGARMLDINITRPERITTRSATLRTVKCECP